MGNMRKSLYEQFGRDAGKVLQGGMMDAADEQPLPERFRVTYADPGNRVLLTDAETGRQVFVGVFALREVRKVLFDLFGPPVPLDERIRKVVDWWNASMKANKIRERVSYDEVMEHVRGGTGSDATRGWCNRVLVVEIPGMVKR
jgi:hypothetical protein